MARVSSRNLTPRNGHTLMAGLGARISGCAEQKEVSLEDQTDHNKEIVQDLFDGLIEYLIIATKGKGERLDRPELAEIERVFREGILDIFVWEDLGRLIRGVEAVRLLGIAVDHGIRVICPNDNVDTANETWEADAIKACADHVAHQEHTSRRIKHKTMNRFIKNGECSARPIAGYIAPKGTKRYSDWQKDPHAESTVLEGDALRFSEQRDPELVERLKNDGWVRVAAADLQGHLNCSATADLLNKLGIATGPYCRQDNWDGAMVRRYFGNTLLKGLPRRGVKRTLKLHEIGRRVSRRNPAGPSYFAAPHLAILAPDVFDKLNTDLDTKNAGCGRQPVRGVDPLLGVPRKRTRFLGQFGRCWYCGRHHVWGGNGVTDNLMCSGSRKWLCWNSIGYNGELAVRKLVEKISAELYQLNDFEEQYRELVEAALVGGRSNIPRRLEELRKEEQKLTEQTENLQDAIAQVGLKPMLKAKLEEIEAMERKVVIERQGLERAGRKRLAVPASLGELREMLEQEFAVAAFDSPNFGELLRKIVLDFRVHLVRLCDGGHPLSRARVKLALDGIVPDAVHIPGVGGLLHREFMLDLFVPPQREQIRDNAVRLAAENLGPNAIAAQIVDLDGKHPTDTAVQNALHLNRLMKEMGLTTPYVPLVEAPNDYAKLRRHKNANYRFTPMDGYVPPTL